MQIQDAEIIFADDRQILERAYSAGAPRSAAVYSASPALLLANDNIVQHDRVATVDRMMALGRESRSCSAKLYDAVFAATGIHGLGIIAARQTLTMQNQIAKAMSLTGEIMDKRVLFTQVQTGNPRRDTILNTPWSSLLPQQMKAETFAADVRIPPEVNRPSDPVAPFFMRLRFESLQSMGYRFGERFSAKVPWFPARGDIWVAHESSLLKETAFHLFARGYRIKKIPTLEPTGAETVDPALLENCEEIYGEFLDRILDDGVSRALLPQCVDDLGKQLTEGTRYLAAWRDRLAKGGGESAPSIVLHGFPMVLSHIALLQACNESGILTAGFQHGVAREISGNLINIESLYENSLVAHYFTYNEKCAERSDENRFALSQAVTVGLPADLVKGIGRAKRNEESPPILYPTTALYTCNMQLPGRACMNDMEKAQFEIGLVTDVFDKLPHRVRYKRYNADRYLDPDPIHETVKASSVEYYDRQIDLRYIARDARVIVVSRATSTVAWCIMSRRPLVFIDTPDQPLSADGRRAFDDAFFCFDACSNGFFDDLRAFLSQPLEQIEAAWEAKADARTDVLQRYVGDQSCRGGARAAKHLLRELAS